MSASAMESGTITCSSTKSAGIQAKLKKPPVMPAQTPGSTRNCDQHSCWGQLYKHKRLPPVPKFKKRAPTRDEEDGKRKGLPVQYRIKSKVTPEDVRYVQEREEYNKAVFEQWKKGKEATFRAQNMDKSR